MSRRYDRITLTGKVEFAEDFAPRAVQERGVPIDLDVSLTIEQQDDPLLRALLERQGKRDEERLLRAYAESGALITMTF